MERIGIYGGTYNPPHIGHMRAAERGVSALNLEKLLIIPTCISPNKQQPEGIATPEQRLQMLKLCFRGKEKIQVSDLELRRGGVSYTYETLEQLKKIYPDKELVLFVGTDMFLSLHNWKCPEKIFQLARIGVFYRGHKDEKRLILEQKEELEQLGAKISLVENPVTEISSTDLRRMLQFDCAEEFLLPEVAELISREKIYGEINALKNLPEPELEAAVVSLLKPNRVAHVLGCRDTAVALAKRWGADPVAAARAALLHDITKALDGPLQLTLCRSYGIILSNFSEANPKTLHALTGSLVADRIFGESEAVINAIASHTTGKADMNTLEKIIYVADYMEPNRNFPGVEPLRKLAYSDLDGALKLGLEMTLETLKEQGREISPESRQALAWLNEER